MKTNRFGECSAITGRTTGGVDDRSAGTGRTIGDASVRVRLMSNFGDRLAGLGERSVMAMSSNCQCLHKISENN